MPRKRDRARPPAPSREELENSALKHQHVEVRLPADADEPDEPLERRATVQVEYHQVKDLPEGSEVL